MYICIHRYNIVIFIAAFAQISTKKPTNYHFPF